MAMTSMSAKKFFSDVEEPSLEFVIRGCKGSVNCVNFSPRENYLISGSSDGLVRLWNLNELKSQKSHPISYNLMGHQNEVYSVAFAPNGEYILSSSKDSTVRLWRVNLDKLSSYKDTTHIVYRCHTAPIRSVHPSSDSSRFCTASDDKSVKVWDSNVTNRLLCSLIGHTNWVKCAKYSYINSNIIASCGDDSSICIWDTRCQTGRISHQQRITTSRRPQGASSGFHYSHLDWHPLCENILATSSYDSSVRVWDLRLQKPIQCYAAFQGPVTSVSFHKSGYYLIASSREDAVKIFDLLEGRVLFTIRNHNGPVFSAKFDRSGEFFASGGDDKLIYTWKSNLPNTTLDEKNDERDLNNVQASVTFNRNIVTQPTKPKAIDYEIDHQFPSHDDGDYRETVDTLEVSSSNTADILMGQMKEVVNQLNNLTETMLLLEARLSKLEDKFDSYFN